VLDSVYLSVRKVKVQRVTVIELKMYLFATLLTTRVHFTVVGVGITPVGAVRGRCVLLKSSFTIVGCSTADKWCFKLGRARKFPITKISHRVRCIIIREKIISEN